MRTKIWLGLFSLIFLGCNQEGEIPDSGSGYYPLDFVSYRIYDVTETSYVSKTETIQRFQLRETFTEPASDEEYLFLKIERRENELENWRSIETIAVRKTERIVEYRENNTSVVKLSFPVSVGVSWDGNALNQNEESIQYYESVENEDKFDDSAHIKVIIKDLPPNIVEQDQRYEIYANGIGLVERSFTEIQFCQQGCSGINEKEDGTILFQRLIEYGSL